jgi:hypothetical protein
MTTLPQVHAAKTSIDPCHCRLSPLLGGWLLCRHRQWKRRAAIYPHECAAAKVSLKGIARYAKCVGWRTRTTTYGPHTRCRSRSATMSTPPRRRRLRISGWERGSTRVAGRLSPVQELLTARRTREPGRLGMTTTWILRGLVRCGGCGRILSIQTVQHGSFLSLLLVPLDRWRREPVVSFSSLSRCPSRTYRLSRTIPPTFGFRSPHHSSFRANCTLRGAPGPIPGAPNDTSYVEPTSPTLLPEALLAGSE